MDYTKWILNQMKLKLEQSITHFQNINILSLLIVEAGQGCKSKWLFSVSQTTTWTYLLFQHTENFQVYCLRCKMKVVLRLHFYVWFFWIGWDVFVVFYIFHIRFVLVRDCKGQSNFKEVELRLSNSNESLDLTLGNLLLY